MVQTEVKYTLSMEQRQSLSKWLRQLSLPDGYSFNFGNKVDPSNTKLQNMESHDHHVFMKVLLPIAFSALQVEVLEPLLALSEFFKDLCANEQSL